MKVKKRTTSRKLNAKIKRQERRISDLKYALRMQKEETHIHKTRARNLQDADDVRRGYWK